MAKRIIITESMAKQLIKEGVVDDVVKSQEFEKKVKNIVKDNTKTDKDIEKLVKKIVAKSVNTFFKTLWTRSNFYESEILK